MTPERLAKVRALANDPRGNAAVRAVAQRILAQYEQAPPPPRQERVPGVEPSLDYRRWMFMDLNNWNETASGNYTIIVDWDECAYRVTLFKHKKTPTWGWLRKEADDDEDRTLMWGRNKYTTVREAHESAWLHLTLI